MRNFICPPLKLWQKDLFDDIIAAGPKAGMVFVVKSMRQIGKSFICLMILIYHALTYKNSVSICVSITFKNCSKMFDELKTGLEDFDFIDKIGGDEMQIVFKNKSKIIFKSAAQRENLRGYTCKNGGILILDECAYLYEDVFGIVFPYVNAHNANILMVSTPRLKQGSFYNYYMTGLNGDSDLVKAYDWSRYDTSELLSPERVELLRSLLPIAQFNSEVLGLFVDGLAGVFNLQQQIFYNGSRIPVKGSYSDIFIGIDWGTGKNQDYTAITGYDSTGKQILLDYFNDKTPEEQLVYIQNMLLNTLDPKKIIGVNCEVNSIGSIYIDRLKALCPQLHIHEFTTSNSSKRDIIEYMISRVNSGTLRIIDEQEQYAQLSAYMMQITKSGAVTYNGEGAHDDIVIANALALKLIKDKEKTGGYRISIPKTPVRYNKIRDRYS